jgi:hypothetical protein
MRGEGPFADGIADLHRLACRRAGSPQATVSSVHKHFRVPLSGQKVQHQGFSSKTAHAETLLHFSQNPNIDVSGATMRAVESGAHLCLAIDAERAPWFPRECPRVTS